MRTLFCDITTLNENGDAHKHRYVLVEDNRIIVRGGGLHAPTTPIDSHNDHRIVMSMAVLLTRLGGSIVGAEAVSKSMPEFFELLSSLGIAVSLS